MKQCRVISELPTREAMADNPLSVMRLKISLNGQEMTIADIVDKTKAVDDGWEINGVFFEDGHPDIRDVSITGLLCNILHSFYIDEARDLTEKFGRTASPEINALLKKIPTGD